MYGDGAVPEGDLLEALNRLLLRQALAQALNRPGPAHRRGLAVARLLPRVPGRLRLRPVAARSRCARSANSASRSSPPPATTRPPGTSIRPASHRTPGGQCRTREHDVLPVVSVGALNPDLHSIALFSNAGDWVCCHRQGAALVSTMPTDLQRLAAAAWPPYDQRRRAAGHHRPGQLPRRFRHLERHLLRRARSWPPRWPGACGSPGTWTLRPGDDAQPRLERAGTADRAPPSEAGAVRDAAGVCTH